MKRTKVRFSENIGEDVLTSGAFGESLIAYYLVKQKLHVLFTRSAGFDLLAKDRKGILFKKNKLIGINVKARQNKSFSIKLDNDIKKLEKASKIYDFEPFFGFVTPLEVLIFPSKIINSKIKTKKGSISFQKLKNLKSKSIKHFKWEIKPQS